MPNTKKDLQDRMAKARAAVKAKRDEEKRKMEEYHAALEAQKGEQQKDVVSFGAPLPEPVLSVPKKTPTTPWKPAKLYGIPEDLKDPRFVYRFVNTKKEGNELKKRQEEWEYDHEIVKKMQERGLLPPRELRDGTPIDGIYRIREMILMRIPRERAESRNEYMVSKGQRGLQEAKASMRKEMPGQGPDYPLYGSFKEEQLKDNIGRR